MRTRILVVDDHELIRTGLRLRLQREDGFDVVAEAPDAATACAIVAEKSPDLVIMDLNLAGEDGLVATATIKAQWPQTRVLALTGDNPAKVARAALLAGADGLIFKNEACDELVRAIHTIVAGKAYLSSDAVTALAGFLRESSPTSESDTPELSTREREVLTGLAEGLSYKELAARLGVSVKSVDTYRARMAKKLGCSNRAELLRCALRLGLTPT